MGVVVPDALVRIQGTKLSQQGPMLITHWGMSGPAVLKLSAWGARDLAERRYAFSIQINWVGISNATEAAETMDAAVDEMRRKKVANACPFELPKKFWAYLLERAEIRHAVWLELGKKAKQQAPQHPAQRRLRGARQNHFQGRVRDLRGRRLWARSTSTRCKAVWFRDSISRARCSMWMA